MIPDPAASFNRFINEMLSKMPEIASLPPEAMKLLMICYARGGEDALRQFGDHLRAEGLMKPAPEEAK